MQAKRHTLANALRVAADQFDADALVHAKEPEGGEGLMSIMARESMVAQFAHQATEARILADEIEQATVITLED